MSTRLSFLCRAGLLGLALACLVPAEARPDREGRLREALERRRAGSENRSDMEQVLLQHGGLSRSYEMFRPARLKSPAPLIIMLHGGGGNGKNAAKMSGFNALAAREGFVVIYPNGTGRGPLLTWNGVHCCQYAMENNIDDVGFISAVIDDMVSKGIADKRRIYVTGMSNGAIMAHRLGRELPNKIAAIAPVVGAVFGDEARASAVPTLIISGALDKNVPAEGGYGKHNSQKSDPNAAPYAPVAAAFDYWTKNNSCSANLPVKSTPDYALHTGAGCAKPVQWYHLTAGTHSWPGGQKGHMRGDEPVRTVDASKLMWDFFRLQSLR